MARPEQDRVLITHDGLDKTIDVPRAQVAVWRQSGWRVVDQPSTRPPDGADGWRDWARLARERGIDPTGLTRSEIRAAAEKAAAKKSPAKRPSTPRSPRGTDEPSTPSKED